MFGLKSADLLHKLHQEKASQVLREAERSRLSHTRRDEPSSKILNTPIRLTLIALLIVGLFAAAQQTFAQGPDLDPGGGDFFPEASLAYRMGHYYLVTGEPDKALEWLTQAFDNMPEEVLLTMPLYQDWYWTLGEAQEAAGLWQEALTSYQQWLMLAGDDAAPWAVAHAQALDEQAATIVEANLISMASSKGG